MIKNVKTRIDRFIEYDGSFILGTYNELLVLRRTGTFPVGQKFYREICDLRHRLYGSERELV